jgi:hypothetical protein
VIDCVDPARDAEFWSQLLGLPVTYRSPEFLVVSSDDRTSGLGFQLAPDHEPATWPDPSIPQQMHLDVMVDDVDKAERQAVALGAKKLGGLHVLADPAGHPFCLIPRPDWASPIGATSDM